MSIHPMQQSMADDGIFPAEQIPPDGIFRRIDDANGKPKNQYIFAVCFGHSGFYGHWITLRDGKNWSSKREVEFTPEERQEYAIQMAKARKDKARAEEERHRECRERSAWKLSQATDEPHPYCGRKGIKQHGFKVYKGRLVIPVYGIDRTLHGLQFIDADGGKKFEHGTAVKGNFYRIPGDTTRPLYLAEGPSTAATIHELTGATVVIAFSCGNLQAVAEVIRGRVGKEKIIVICADNDRLTAGNPGLTCATAAAVAIGASVAIPEFPGDLGTDFNDMSALSGTEAVRHILETAARPAPPTVVEVIQRYELRPYQLRALNEIKQAIAGGYHSIMVQAPTGSGKGVILSHIINLCHEKGSSVLFLVQLQEILYQVSAYLNHYGIDHGIIKAGEDHEHHHHVQLASFQTIHRRLKSPYIRQADVIIVDEAHHATAATYLRLIQEFKKKIVLGFSATPSRQNGLGLGNIFDKMIQVATIRELTELGYLAPVRVFAPVKPDLDGVKVTAGDYNAKQLETAMNKAGLVGDIVGHWKKYGDNRKTFVFASGVKHSIALCQQFHAAGISAAHVDGKTPKEDRVSILARFKAGSIQVIVNCQVYTEGVDVPDVGCIVLARPTKSLSMYLQMVGRGMRAVSGKTDCILLDHAGAVYEHGFPDEIEEWELSTSGKTTNKTNERRKKRESEPIGCPACGLLYTRQLRCPGCGNVPSIKQFGKDLDYIDGSLGEIVRKSTTKKPEPTNEVKASWYRQLKHFCQLHGYSGGWTSHKFREKFGVWPNFYAHLPPAEEMTPEVLGWIRHTQIKRAKSPHQAA